MSIQATPTPNPATMENYRNLPLRLKRFAEVLVATGNQAAAARHIKPDSKNPRGLGWKLSQNPRVAAALVELDAHGMERAGITTTRTWLEVARVAYFDPRKLVDEDGMPIPLHKLDPDTAAAIGGIDVEELFEGRGESRERVGTLKKYRPWSKTDAQKMILQAKRELIERHEMSGPEGGPMRSVTITTEDPVEAARAYQELIRGG